MIRFASASINFSHGAVESSETAPDAPTKELRGGREGLTSSTSGDEEFEGSAGSRTASASRARQHSPANDPDGDDCDADEVDDLETLADQIATLAAHIHAATHQLLVLIAEFDRRRGWALDGHRSCAHWLAFRTGIELVTAREKVRVARALRDLPQTGQAMSRGELSFAKVRALTRAANASNEGELLEFARDTTAAQLEHTVRSMKLLSRRDEIEQERERHRRRAFSVFRDGTGMYEVRGRLDPEVAAVLMRAVEAAGDALYVSACDVEEVEPRQRRADAVGLVAERALAAGFGEVSGQHGPAGASENRHARPAEGRHACRCDDGNACRSAAGHDRRAIDEKTHRPGSRRASRVNHGNARRSKPAGAEPPDVPAAATAHEPGWRGARRRALGGRNDSAEARHVPPTAEANGISSVVAEPHDALPGNTVDGPEHCQPDVGQRLEHHSSAEAFRPTLSSNRAERYQVVIHVDPDTLRSDVESGRSELADGTRLSPETARRLSCDAGVVRVTRGRDGSILDVGRRTRTISPALRRVLEIRDGGCCFPGCGSRFVEAHHIMHWADGGETNLSNCCFVCRAHHRLVHEEGYRIEFPPGGTPTFYTPRGLPVPDTPPRLPKATLEALVRANLCRSVSPDGWTCTARYEREADIPWPVLAKVLDAIDS